MVNPTDINYMLNEDMPVNVNFYFEDSWDLSARDEWMKRFDMYTQRGGG